MPQSHGRHQRHFLKKRSSIRLMISLKKVKKWLSPDYSLVICRRRSAPKMTRPPRDRSASDARSRHPTEPQSFREQADFSFHWIKRTFHTGSNGDLQVPVPPGDAWQIRNMNGNLH